jgi:2-dehydro-3-deoxyphosphogluconate aldolase/(4S)-4-hydroxy-2-oxoglutarate aldolase
VERLSRDAVLEFILASKLIVVLRLSAAAGLDEIAGALWRGGVVAIEVTMTTPGALEAIRRLSRAKPDGTLVGAGTVLDPEAAVAAVGAGAEFAVSPVTDVGVIDACRRLGTLAVPGALTPTEILAAWHRGADIVKVFPATALGPQYFRDLKGPLPGIRLMPTGGVGPANAKAFIDAGACAVAVGSSLVGPKVVEGRHWAGLTAAARRLVDSLHGG